MTGDYCTREGAEPLMVFPRGQLKTLLKL